MRPAAPSRWDAPRGEIVASAALAAQTGTPTNAPTPRAAPAVPAPAPEPVPLPVPVPASAGCGSSSCGCTSQTATTAPKTSAAPPLVLASTNPSTSANAASADEESSSSSASSGDTSAASSSADRAANEGGGGEGGGSKGGGSSGSSGGGWFARNADGSPWVVRALRITNIRVVSQVFFFSLFIFLLWVTWFSRLEGYPASLFLELDPLVGVATAISTHSVYRWLWRGMLILVPTLLIGRLFCGWICPYGALHQFVGWLFNIRSNKSRIDKNRYRPLFQLKYYILAIMLLLAVFGALQIGLLDPICLLARSVATAIAPAIDSVAPADWSWLASAPGAPAQRVFNGAWFVGLMLMILVGLNLVIPRFFCRVLCPLGAFLGAISRWAFWRIDRDVTKCTDCDLCLKSCEGASDPHDALRKSECFVCFNCIDDCPEDALSFKLAPASPKAALAGNVRRGQATLLGKPVISKRPDTEIAPPDVPRRRWVLAAVAGVIAFPFLRFSKAVNKRGFSKKAIRPPGTVAEDEFLERCIKCDQCINVCPTNVLQPSGLSQGGFEGLWTPVMDFSVGFCQLNCTLCSEVCPTGAIQKISLEQKLGLGKSKKQGPIRLGTAFFNRGRCLPWSMETPCVVCEEVCPVSPKAIGTYTEVKKRWDGTTVTLNKPYMRPELCIGCGICEHECPVLDDAAVYVTAIGESRSKDRTLLLKSKQNG